MDQKTVNQVTVEQLQELKNEGWVICASEDYQIDGTVYYNAIIQRHTTVQESYNQITQQQLNGLLKDGWEVISKEEYQINGKEYCNVLVHK